MSIKKKYSMFISSTYEDLIEERQAVIGVALENDIIPVGMEQFHAAPASQWDVITKMIDECDGYLLIIGGRYGSIDDAEGISYTEKEYNYAKSKGLPVLVLIRKDDAIIATKMDTGDAKHTKLEKQDLLVRFKDKVKNDGNTVDFFTDINNLKYITSQALSNSKGYFPKDSGWVRYSELKGAEDSLMVKDSHLTVSFDNVIQNAEFALFGDSTDSPESCDSKMGKIFLSIPKYLEENGIDYSKEGNENKDDHSYLVTKGLKITYIKSLEVINRDKLDRIISAISVSIAARGFRDSLSLVLDILKSCKVDSKMRIKIKINSNYGFVRSTEEAAAIISSSSGFSFNKSQLNSYIYTKYGFVFSVSEDTSRKRMANLLGGEVSIACDVKTATSDSIIELVERLVEIGFVNKSSTNT